MTLGFLLDDEKFLTLADTSQGRVSIGGFAYQAAYAVARLASMLARQPLLDLDDIPVLLRYDWAEDLDEIDSDGRSILTQCKRINDLGQPRSLADALIGFAPKFLWTPHEYRSQLRFRIVSTDRRFQSNGPITFDNAEKELAGSKVRAAALTTLQLNPHEGSDRALWQALGESFGLERLVDELWHRTEAIYVRGDVVSGDPSGMALLPAERIALDLLIRWQEVDTEHQAEALRSLRGLVHSDVIVFDPASEVRAPLKPRTPRINRRTDVAAALFPLRRRQGARPVFRVVGRRYLEQQADKEKNVFIARPPEWADVIHGEDAAVRFVERDLTQRLVQLIRTHIIDPLIHRSDERLRTIFVLGAPGAGKSTIVRRAAAILVKEGAVTVADFGMNLTELDDREIATILLDLDRLASDQCPVLLLLDDPFFAGSGWDTLFARLARAGLRVGIIGASPEFLFEKFGECVRRGAIATELLQLPSPSERERRVLCSFYGQTMLSGGSPRISDFLVLAMEAASGESFNEIVNRIWMTLNDGQPVDRFALPEALPWPIRAYLVTCYFHRAHVRCPEHLLREALAIGGKTAIDGFEYFLSQLTLSAGWRVFSTQTSRHGPHRDVGRTIGCIHQRIASHAWQLRPVPAFDVAEWVIPASLRSEQPYSIGRLACALKSFASHVDVGFGRRLAQAWSQASETGIHTAKLSGLAEVLATNGGFEEAQILIPPLYTRAARVESESWTAALQLWRLSSSKPEARAFPEALDIATIIEVADFTCDRYAVPEFGTATETCPAFFSLFIFRLLTALEGNADWEVDARILSWMLMKVPASVLTQPRLQRIRTWLEEHPSDTFVRHQFLDRLEEIILPLKLRESMLHDTVTWLAEHPEDSSIRTKFLRTIEDLPSDSTLRKRVLSDTVVWLQQHVDDLTVRQKLLDTVARRSVDTDIQTAVLRETMQWLEYREQQLLEYREQSQIRAKFLSIVGRLPEESELRIAGLESSFNWLRQHPENAIVRNALLKIVKDIAPGNPLWENFLRDTATWLDQNPQDATVRPKFLDVVASLPPGSQLREEVLQSNLAWLTLIPRDQRVRARLVLIVGQLPPGVPVREEVLQDAVQWLRSHPKDARVRAALVAVANTFPPEAELRASIFEEAALWIEQHPKDYEVRAKFFASTSSTELILRILKITASLLDEHRGNRSWDAVARTVRIGVERTLVSLDQPLDETGLETLRMVQQSLLNWFYSVKLLPPALPVF